MRAWSEHLSAGPRGAQAGGFAPVAVVEIELTQPLTPISATDATGHPYGGARLLVRLHSRSLGMVDVPAAVGGFTATHCARLIWDHLGEAINRHLRADGLPEVARVEPGGFPAVDAPRCTERRRAILARAPLATVVVCTRERPGMLRRALTALAKLEYPAYETLVVDGSLTASSEDLVRAEFPDVIYIRLSPGGGLVVGRNRGLAAAKGEFIAYTDDDAVADRHWLAELVAAFDDEGRVACATGLAAPLELATPAQLWCEETGPFVDGFDRRVVGVADRDRHSLLPYATKKIGAGVSMAWRTSVLRGLHGFDLAFDGTSADDLAAFFDALIAGYQIVYEPGALVFHEHRREYDELREQIYNHALGLGAHLTRCILEHPARTLDFVRRVPRGIMYGFSPSSARNRQKSEHFPAGLTLIELPALAKGPWAYLAWRRRARRRPPYDGPAH